MSALIGALRVSLSADTAQFEAGMRRAQSTANNAASGISRTLGRLKAGVSGLVAGLSIGMFVDLIGKSLEYAGSLAEVAQQVGVTAKDLQVLRYAAGQVGVEQEQLETGLSKLTITLGKVAAGAVAPTKALKAIGVTADELKGKDTGEAFRIIADGLQKVTDRSQRAAVEVTLFGKTGSRLDNLLSGGSAAINELSEAAEKLGIVISDEQIQRADETADKIRALKTVLAANISKAVADNASSILTLGNALAFLVQKAAEGVSGLRLLYHELKAYDNALGGDLKGYTTEMNAAKAIRYGGIAYGKGSVTMKLPPARFKTPTEGGADIGNFLAPGGGAKKTKTDHSAEDALRNQYQFEQEERRAQMDILQAKQDLARDYIERTALSIDMLNAEKADHEAELQYQVALFKLTKGKEGMSDAQAAASRALFDQKDSLERQKVLQDEMEQRQKDIQDLTEGDYNRRRDVLESQAAIATTAAERRKIELELLRLAYEQKRQALQFIIDNSKNLEEQEQARRDLANLNKTYGNAQQGVMQGTRGPLEEWAAHIPKTAAEINEALQAIEAQGLDSLSDAITNVITGTESLKEAFGDLARSIIADIIRMTIRMLIFRALSSVFGGIFGSGGAPGGPMSLSGLSMGSGGDVTSSGIYSGIPGFASGGSMRILGRGGTDRNLLSLNGLPIARVSAGERVNIANDNADGGPARVVIELRDEMLDARIVQGAGQVVIAAAPSIVGRSRDTTLRSISRPKL